MDPVSCETLKVVVMDIILVFFLFFPAEEKNSVIFHLDLVVGAAFELGF